MGIGEGVARRKGLAIGDNEGRDERTLEEYVDRGGGQFTDRCVSSRCVPVIRREAVANQYHV